MLVHSLVLIMCRIIKLLSKLIIFIVLPLSVRAELTISICAERLGADNLLYTTRNKIDYALFAANGSEWYLDKILFSDDIKGVSIFFAPGNVICFNSRRPIGEELEIGIKRAIDYLSEKGDTLFLPRPKYDFDITKAMKDNKYLDEAMEQVYEKNFRHYFVWFRYSNAIFGNLDMAGAEKLVEFFYSAFTAKFPYGGGDPEQSRLYMEKYNESCGLLGLSPIAKNNVVRRSDYTEDEINHYLDYRFSGPGFRTDIKDKLYSVPILSYRATSSNTGPFQFFKSRFYHLADPQVCNTERRHTLALAVYPDSINSMGIVKSASMVNRALYEANGRDWYVEHVLFGTRRPSSLYFTTGGMCTYRSWNVPDSSFVIGVSKAINLLALKNDTLYAPVNEWPHNDCDGEQLYKIVRQWQAQNLMDFLLGEDWGTKIETGRVGIAALEYDEQYNPFGFKELCLWPRLENGTKEGRAFRMEYERNCIEKGFNPFDETEIGQRHKYSDADIDLYLEWVMKADDFYIHLPAPTFFHIMDFNYPMPISDPLLRLTIREVCEQ